MGWAQVKTNLQAAKIRLVFVADEIPPELRRIVEFLNATMDPVEVLAVEIHQYVGQGLKTLVPRVMGQTADAQARKGAGSRQARTWDEAAFLAELERRPSFPLAVLCDDSAMKQFLTALDWTVAEIRHG